jgi:hypothetical protein
MPFPRKKVVPNFFSAFNFFFFALMSGRVEQTLCFDRVSISKHPLQKKQKKSKDGRFKTTIRVTGLAEFSLIGRLFSMGSFSKIAEVAQIFLLLFPRCINLGKTWIGLHFGLLFSAIKALHIFRQKFVGLHFWGFFYQ